MSIAHDGLWQAFRNLDGDAHTALATARHNVSLMTALRASQLEHGEAIAGLVTDVTDLKVDVAVLKVDVAEVKSDVAGLRSDMAEVLRRLPV